MAAMVKVNGSEVSVEESGKTVVNINISQESSLSYLVKAVAAAGRKWPEQKAPTPKTLEPSAPARAQCTGEQKVLGGAQILLGVMCLGLGGVLFLFHDYIRLQGSGAPFWMGSLFIVSGSLCVLSERRRGCWVPLATFFNLASFIAGCVGLAYGVADLPFLSYTPYWIDNLCKREEESYLSWRPTRNPDNDWRVQACVDKMANLLSIFSGVQILLLISSVAAMGIALFCFGYGLRVLCCRLRANSEDYVAVGNLEVPPPYEEAANENPTA